MVRVAVVGLGVIASTHLHVLGTLPGVEVVAAVDPDPRARAGVAHGIPAFAETADMVAAVGPDVCVVCVPTALHLPVCRELVDLGVRELLVEKPIAADRAGVAALLGHARVRGAVVTPLLHFAHSEEIEWSAGWLRRNAPRHGGVVTLAATFADPYSADLEAKRASLAGSWLDSGVNALSVAGTLVPVGDLLTCAHLFDDPAEGVAATFALDGGGRATIVTYWRARRSSKRTVVVLADGTALMLDHTAGSAVAFGADGLLDGFFPATHESTRDSHYARLYRAWRAGADLVAPSVAAHDRTFDVQERLDAD